MAAHDSAPVIGRSIALQVHSRQHEIESLPAPDTVWKWSAVGTSQGTLQVLRDAHLIRSVPDRPGAWETTARLARFLRERHNIDLEAGQQQLDTGWQPDGEVDAPPVAPGVQIALDGTLAPADDVRDDAEGESDATGDDAEAEAAAGKGQMKLDAWMGQMQLEAFAQ